MDALIEKLFSAANHYNLRRLMPRQSRVSFHLRATEVIAIYGMLTALTVVQPWEFSSIFEMECTILIIISNTNKAVHDRLQWNALRCSSEVGSEIFIFRSINLCLSISIVSVPTSSLHSACNLTRNIFIYGTEEHSYDYGKNLHLLSFANGQHYEYAERL